MDRPGDRVFIGGKWVSSQSRDRFQIISASTEEVIGVAPESSPADIDAAVASARNAFEDQLDWSHWAPAQRADVLERFADVMAKRGEEIARLVTSQNGMPATIAVLGEATAGATLLRFYANLLRSTSIEEERPSMTGGTTVVRRLPIGVVAAIVPWNFPQTVTFFKVAAALAAGNTVVMKPSPETVLDSYEIADAANEAGIPPGVLNIVTGGPEAGMRLVAHPGVDKVAFTGSTPTGRAIGEVCGRLLRPVTLELGGKSATIILDDADVADQVPKLFGCTLANSGQTCILGTRILAPRRRYDEIVDAVASMASNLPIGDPFDPDTLLGPLVSSRQRDRVERYIAKGRDEARLVVGGRRPPGLDRGWYVAPTVFADVSNDAIIAREEIFGPVLSVIAYDDDDDAVRIANDSDYGLAGSVWSADPDRARAVATQVRTGTIGVNFYNLDFFNPFGGFKNSGVGRELGPEGLAAFQQLQSLYLG